MNPLNTVRELFAKVPLFGRLSDFEVTRGTVLAGVGYLLFGLVVFCLVFAARYYVVQTDALVREVVGKLDGVTVEFPHLEPQLVPPRVTVEYVRVYHKKTRKPILLLKDTDLRLSFLPLLMGKLSLSATSRAYGGLVDIDLSTGAFFNTDWLSVDVRTEMIDLGTIPQIKSFDRSLKGFLTIDASVQGAVNALLEVEGEVVARLDRLDMENRFPVIKGARLKGFSMNLDCSMEKGVWSFSQLDIVSTDGISLKTAGALSVDAKNFQKSTFEMNGKFLGSPKRLATSVLDPKAVAMMKKKQAVPVQLRGSIANPQVLLK